MVGNAAFFSVLTLLDSILGSVHLAPAARARHREVELVVRPRGMTALATGIFPSTNVQMTVYIHVHDYKGN